MKKRVLMLLLLSLILIACNKTNNDNIETTIAESTTAETTVAEKTMPETTTAPPETTTEAAIDVPEEINLVIKENVFRANDDKIIIKYPVVSGFYDSEVENKVNDVIQSEIIRDVFRDDTENKSYYADFYYEITFMNEELLSLICYGNWGSDNSPHPWNDFIGMTIDLKTGEKVRLKDIVNTVELLDRYNEAIKNSTATDISKAQYEYIDRNYTAEDLLAYFNETQEYQNNINSKYYITKDSLGISNYVIHAIGDHAEIEIPFTALETLNKRFKEASIESSIKKLNQQWQTIKEEYEQTNESDLAGVILYLDNLIEITSSHRYFNMSDANIKKLIPNHIYNSHFSYRDSSKYRLITCDFKDFGFGKINGKWSIIQWQNNNDINSQILFSESPSLPVDFFIDEHQGDKIMTIGGYDIVYTPKPVFVSVWDLKDNQWVAKKIPQGILDGDVFKIYDNEVIFDKNKTKEQYSIRNNDYETFYVWKKVNENSDEHIKVYYDFHISEGTFISNKYDVNALLNTSTYEFNNFIEEGQTFIPFKEQCYAFWYNKNMFYHIAGQRITDNLAESVVFIVDENGEVVEELKSFGDVAIKNTRFIDLNNDNLLDYVVLTSKESDKTQNEVFVLFADREEGRFIEDEQYTKYFAEHLDMAYQMNTVIEYILSQTNQ